MPIHACAYGHNAGGYAMNDIRRQLISTLAHENIYEVDDPMPKMIRHV
jgi:hypothetical protein